MKNIIVIAIAALILSGCVEAVYDSARFVKGIGQKETWKTLALQGDAEAQYRVGELYCCGERPEYDNVKALRWWCMAAKQEQRDAMFEVARMYEDAHEYKGNIIPKNDLLAYTYYQLAVENGNIEAKKDVDRLYAKLKTGDIKESAELMKEFPNIECEITRDIQDGRKKILR